MNPYLALFIGWLGGIATVIVAVMIIDIIVLRRHGLSWKTIRYLVRRSEEREE